MGFPKNLKAVIRKLNDDVVIVSTPFTYMGLLNLGGRTALIKCQGGIVLWSPVPYGDYIVEALQLLTGNTSSDPADYNLSFIVALSTEHYMGVKSMKEKFPSAEVISSEHMTKALVDYKLPDSQGNKVITMDDICFFNQKKAAKGFDELEFVYLPAHLDREVVVYFKPKKMLFEADILINVGMHGTTTGDVVLEQFSPELGFPKGFNPHGGVSFFTRYFQPYSKLYTWTFSRIFPRAHRADAKTGYKVICSWDFETIVPCHGNVITSGAKAAMRKVCLLE